MPRPAFSIASIGCPLVLLSCLSAMLVLGGCDRDSPGTGNNTNGGNANSTNSNNCPATQPEDGTACTDPGVSRCSWVVELCSCWHEDLYAYCHCNNDEWYCFREYDCYSDCRDGGV